MIFVHNLTSARNNFQLIPLPRPRIERERGGDRRAALLEFEELERIERAGHER